MSTSLPVRLTRVNSRVRHFAKTLRQFIFNNTKLKILAFAIAILLFAASRQPQREIMVVNVPLEFINIAPDLEISGEVPNAVSVRLRGAQDLVQGITPNQLEVKANLKDKGSGERVIFLEAKDVTRPDKVEVRRIEPDAIELKLEPTLSKYVPVEIQFSGRAAEGFAMQNYKISPAQILIEGPESRIQQVTRIMTESIVLTGRRASFQLPVDVEPHQQGVRFPKHQPVHIEVTIAPQKNVE